MTLVLFKHPIYKDIVKLEFCVLRLNRGNPEYHEPAIFNMTLKNLLSTF